MPSPAVAGNELKQALKKFQSGIPTVHEQTYLYGFRGYLVIQVFLWMFLQTFVPVAVAASSNSHGPLYQIILRKTLSVIFWNENLLYGTVVFLSARSVAIPFLRNPCKEILARSMMTRGISLWFPVAVSLAIVKICSNTMGQSYIYNFQQATGNRSMSLPYYIPNAFAYFNSVFDLFWVTHDFKEQAGSTAFPTQTLWIVNLVYSQSYTVFITMIIIPYTRAKWRVQGAIFFVIAAWWVQSWAWFTISGLLFCDMVMNMDFKEKAQRGIPLRLPFGGSNQPGARGNDRRIPVWAPAVICLGVGLLLQFLWVAWKPNLLDAEYFAHTNIYTTGGINHDYKNNHSDARVDNYLYVVGLFILLETYDIVQKIFGNPFFTYLGKRSLSYFLIQAPMIYTVGIKTFSSLRTTHNVNFGGSCMVTLITCLAVIVPLAELFYRCVEIPSRIGAHKFYDFMTS